jgi:hypothetical protein
MSLVKIFDSIFQAWALKQLWIKRPLRPTNFSSDVDREKYDRALKPSIDGTPTGNIPPSRE